MHTRCFTSQPRPPRKNETGNSSGDVSGELSRVSPHLSIMLDNKELRKLVSNQAGKSQLRRQYSPAVLLAANLVTESNKYST